MLVYCCFHDLLCLSSIDCTIDGAKVWEKQGRKDAKNERRKQDSNETSKHNCGEVVKHTSGFGGNDPAVSGFSDPQLPLVACDQLFTFQLSISGFVIESSMHSFFLLLVRLRSWNASRCTDLRP